MTRKPSCCSHSAPEDGFGGLHREARRDDRRQMLAEIVLLL
jgi:hypothetical protein